MKEGKGKTLVVPAQGPLHRACTEDGIAACSVCMPCDELAGWDTSERVPERPGTSGKKENVQNKVRTRGWKGDRKLIPFGYGSLKKGYAAVPFLLIKIIVCCYQNHMCVLNFKISQVHSTYQYYLPCCLQ